MLALIQLGNLCEVIVAQFDEWHRREGACRVHDQRAFFERVQVRHDQQQVLRLLHGQEATPRHVDADRALEVFHRRAGRRFQLDHVDAVVQMLVVDYHFDVEPAVGNQLLDRLQADPQVVRVEDSELLDRLELVDMFFRNLPSTSISS